MKFSPDIEGLRAVSILLVVIYHYFPSAIGGGYVGVDVFFVISGYLITHSLVGQVSKSASLRPWLLQFWGRRARRLLPNALLVLLVVAALGFTSLSDYAVKKLGSDVLSSAAYSVNWLFILRSVDYLQWDEAGNSVLLNFWSLAVEEQFYLVWPLLLYVALGKAARNEGVAQGLDRARQLTLLVLCLSFGYCIWLGSRHLTVAFFSLPSRAWELLVGAALALWLLRSASPFRLAAVTNLASWCGFAAIAGSGLLFSDDTLHPGFLTLIPVGGAVLMIWSSATHGVPASLAWLRSRPFMILGKRSYSIYLWHWPVLILGKMLWPGVSGAGLLALLALSLLVAEVAYRWVELPARFRWRLAMSPAHVVVTAVMCSVSVATVGFALRVSGATSGREVLGLRSPVRGGLRLPDLKQVHADIPAVYKVGCHLALEAVEHPDCVFGDPHGRASVVLFGDSHAAQWFPALDQVARSRGVRLHSFTKSGCPSADVAVWNQAAKGLYRQCGEWRERIFQRIEQLHPEVVIVSNLVEDATVLVDERYGRVRGREAAKTFTEGLVRTIEQLQSHGARVVVLRDTPRPRPDILDCLYVATDPKSCALTRVEATRGPLLDLEAAARTSAVVWDITDSICTSSACPVVWGHPLGVVYRDSNHLAASYVAGQLAVEVDRRWGELPGVGKLPGSSGR